MTAMAMRPSAQLPAVLAAIWRLMGLGGLMGLAGVVLQAGPAGAIGAGPARTAQGPPQFLPLEAEWCLEQPALAPAHRPAAFSWRCRAARARWPWG